MGAAARVSCRSHGQCPGLRVAPRLEPATLESNLVTRKDTNERRRARLWLSVFPLASPARGVSWGAVLSVSLGQGKGGPVWRCGLGEAQAASLLPAVCCLCRAD